MSLSLRSAGSMGDSLSRAVSSACPLIRATRSRPTRRCARAFDRHRRTAVGQRGPRTCLSLVDASPATGSQLSGTDGGDPPGGSPRADRERTRTQESPRFGRFSPGLTKQQLATTASLRVIARTWTSTCVGVARSEVDGTSLSVSRCGARGGDRAIRVGRRVTRSKRCALRWNIVDSFSEFSVLRQAGAGSPAFFESAE